MEAYHKGSIDDPSNWSTSTLAGGSLSRAELKLPISAINDINRLSCYKDISNLVEAGCFSKGSMHTSW